MIAVTEFTKSYFFKVSQNTFNIVVVVVVVVVAVAVAVVVVFSY